MRRSCAMPAFASQRQSAGSPGQGRGRDAGAARRIALAPERSGGVQVEGGQTGIAAFFLASEEKAAAVGEGQQVANAARFQLPSATRLGEQAVERGSCARRKGSANAGCGSPAAGPVPRNCARRPGCRRRGRSVAGRNSSTPSAAIRSKRASRRARSARSPVRRAGARSLQLARMTGARRRIRRSRPRLRPGRDRPCPAGAG